MRIIRGYANRGESDVDVAVATERAGSIAADDNDTNSHCHSGYRRVPWLRLLRPAPRRWCRQIRRRVISEDIRAALSHQAASGR